MPSLRKQPLDTPSSTIARDVEKATRQSEKHDEREKLTARKADMLQRRQADLDILMDKHDDLVREAFQLDKFVTLLSYDPEVAKQDNSQVFLEYKAPHDLFTKSAAAASGSGTYPRKTRRATTEFRESLAATISTGPLTPPSTSLSTPSKGKAKASVVSKPHTASPLGRKIGKTKILTKSIPSKVSSSAIRAKGMAKELHHASPSGSLTEIMPPPPPLSRRDHHPRRPKDAFPSSTPSNSEPSVPSPIPRLRTLTRMSLSSPSSPQPRKRSERVRRSLGDLKTHPVPPEPLKDSVSQELPKPPIKRVRLFQRPRPATYTHPGQIPPHPLYRNSIAEFLTSFISLEDGTDAARDELEHASSAEAKTRARIRDLRRQGRLMLDIPELLDGSIGISSLTAPNDAETHEVTRRGDHYDHLVFVASRRGSAVAAEHAARKIAAKRVAKLVMAWHGNRETAEEKQRKLEVGRIKNLAKFTIKEVEKQWKKAVVAVRDQYRAVLDAEEARLGRKHLDAILDQSGAILEAQHTDLSRTRSRSSSARDWSISSESDGNVEEGSEETSVDVGSDTSEEVVADDDANVTLLLGTDAFNSVDNRRPSSDLESDSALLEIGEPRSHGSSSKEMSPSGSESSLNMPRMNEEMDLSVSTTSSEVALDSSRSTGIKPISSTVSPQDGDNDQNGISQMDESPSNLSKDNHDLASISVDKEPKLDTPMTACSRQNSYGNSSSSWPSLPEGDTSATRSTASVVPDSSLLLHSQQLPPLDLPIVSCASQADDGVTPSDLTSDNRTVLSGHKSAAVHLSDGVVVYRHVDPSSLEEASGIDSTSASIRMNGDQQGNSPASRDSTGSAMEGTGELLDPPAENQRVSQRDTLTAIDGVEPTVDPTLGSISVENHGDRSPPDTPPTTVANGGQEVAPVKTGDEATPPGASPDVADAEDSVIDKLEIAPHLADFAAAPVEWDATSKVNPPFLLRGTLRPYQQSGLEWLASLHTNSLNGILADEMGLGKTIQTISLLAHLACDLGIWGPHLIIVPTSVLLNWEMEFKKFLPGFKILPYHGSTKRRKELRVGWNNRYSFNVCVTSYTLASRDAHIFKRKFWYYMILDEAHMIKNFKSQRWNILLMFRSFRRLLLTGTPLQNNLTELWALLQFLMSGTNFANLKEFGDWFSNPLEKAIEQGTVLDEETQERVRKLHTVLRPYLLRRLKIDVEKELPSKYEHLVMCRLSKRQRFLYDEFMSRAQTRDALTSGVYHKVANILMQLRKVCNHPDLFEVRPIVTSFAMPRSATMDFEIKELLLRRRFLDSQEDTINLGFLGLVFVQHQGKSMMQARSTRNLDASSCLPFVTELPGEPPPADTRTIEGFKRHMKYQQQLAILRQWTQISYINRLRCAASPVYGSETISIIRRLHSVLMPSSEADFCHPDHLNSSRILPTLIKSYGEREGDMAGFIDRFAFVTPPAVARDMPSIALSGHESQIFRAESLLPRFDTILHRASVKLQIAFPDASLIQYDCGKLQELASLLHKRKAGGHRVLIFTQMTKVLDILEIFLNFHGYRYLRLDGATKIEDRQYITERFNNDVRVFAFIASSRSGGVGINLTGADTVVFYDSDFNPQMDRQCEDRAHRIGQIRDVHIYRFISEHTVEESMLRKANQKRSLDNIVIQQGEFDWRSLFIDDEAFGKALGEFEDKEDAHAARVAAREEAVKEVEDNADFAGDTDEIGAVEVLQPEAIPPEDEEPEEDGTIADYMLAFVKRDWEWFSTWR